jgi:hypothetical protein
MCATVDTYLCLLLLLLLLSQADKSSYRGMYAKAGSVKQLLRHNGYKKRRNRMKYVLGSTLQQIELGMSSVVCSSYNTLVLTYQDVSMRTMRKALIANMPVIWSTVLCYMLKMLLMSLQHTV